LFLSARASGEPEKMVGDSLVLAGETPGALLGDGIDPKSIVVRSTYEPGGTIYEAGRDYVYDSKARTIARLPGSRIPDFATNVLFGKKDFNHSQFPGFSNNKFFVFVDYTYDTALKLTAPTDVSKLLPKTTEKLKSGKSLKVIAFGDSIAAGGEATTEALQFQSRFVEHLKKKHPTANITLENGSTGGDRTYEGIARLEEKVLTRNPDLVLVAFGMNDHNIGGTPLPAFKENLKQIISRIREKTGAEVILLSTFPPHPDWHFGSHQMEKYAEATVESAKENGVAYADVFSVWEKVLKRKDASSLLGNNINHPNDFGHWLYLKALEALKF
jgi:acyl-CoA thioesterase-1